MNYSKEFFQEAGKKGGSETLKRHGREHFIKMRKVKRAKKLIHTPETSIKSSLSSS